MLVLFLWRRNGGKDRKRNRERETYHRYDTVSRAERPRRKVVATGPPLGFRRFAGPTSSRLRNSLASLDSCVPASRPGDHRRRRSGIPRNHLNPARIRFRTCCPPRSPARPSPRRHLDGKRNKLSSVLPSRFNFPLALSRNIGADGNGNEGRIERGIFW